MIELIVTILLISIVFSVVSIYLSYPIRVYSGIAKRAELVDLAEVAIRRMERDIRNALPNSIRVKNSSVNSLEIINVVEGLRYRSTIPGTADDILDFSTADSSFNVLGTFNSAQLGTNNYRLVIYNTGAIGFSSDDPIAGANVYASLTSPGIELPLGSHVVTPSTTTVTLSNPGTEGKVTLNPAFQFSLRSPQQRVYVIDTPINYVCDLNNQTITRYSSYEINQIQPVSANIAPLNGASSALLVDHVTSCNFTYQPGTSQRAGIVIIDITISDGSERVRLLQQVGVANVP